MYQLWWFNDLLGYTIGVLKDLLPYNHVGEGYTTFHRRPIRTQETIPISKTVYEQYHCSIFKLEFNMFLVHALYNNY